MSTEHIHSFQKQRFKVHIIPITLKVMAADTYADKHSLNINTVTQQNKTHTH